MNALPYSAFHPSNFLEWKSSFGDLHEQYINRRDCSREVAQDPDSSFVSSLYVAVYCLFFFV